MFGFSFDTTVNLGMVGAVLLQLAAGIWFLSKDDSRISELEQSKQVSIDILKKHSDDLTQLKVDVGQTKTAVTDVQGTVNTLLDLAMGKLNLDNQHARR